MIRTISALLIASSMLAPVAFAGELDGSVSATAGVGSAFDPQPESMRFSLRGEALAWSDGDTSLGILLPVSVEGSGQDGDLGMNTDRMAMEVAPSLRVRTLEDQHARPYADGGLGVVHAFNQIDNWYGASDFDRRTGWMSRFAVGAEFGGEEAGELYAIIEPAAVNIYGVGESINARYAGNIGMDARF